MDNRKQGEKIWEPPKIRKLKFLKNYYGTFDGPPEDDGLYFDNKS
jgi:hypothetical protein